MTGWMFSRYWVRSEGPKPKLKLFWKGKLIMSATGFCAALASSDLSSWAGAAPARSIRIIPAHRQFLRILRIDPLLVT